MSDLDPLDAAMAKISAPSPTGEWLKSLTPVLDRMRQEREAEEAADAIVASVGLTVIPIHDVHRTMLALMGHTPESYAEECRRRRLWDEKVNHIKQQLLAERDDGL